MTRSHAEEEVRSLEVAESARESEWRKPSFVGELFMGQVRSELIFPFPEQEAGDRAKGDEILAKLAPFLAEKVDADRIDAEKEIPPGVIDALREMGLFGIKIPQEYGGLGMSQVNYNRIIQMIAGHCASTAVMLSAHQSIGVPQPLKLFGTEEQKRIYLPRLARGAMSAFALTEPGVGSDPSKMTTRAIQGDEGDWLISGEKLWISNGPVAEVMIVMARTNALEEERPEITAFIVEGNSDGLSTVHRCDFMGLKGIQNGLLRFENVRVPAKNMLGGRGDGLRLALITLNTGRLTLPAACGGAMKQILAISREWANDRTQWGAPVGRHEAVAAKIASMAGDLFAVESLTWLTSAMADRQETDIRLEAAMAKLFCSEALWRAADGGVQVRGGRGYETADSLRGRHEPPMPMERLMRDARINLIIEGTSEIMRLFIAREALDPHLRTAGVTATAQKIRYKDAAKFYASWYPRLWMPRKETDPAVVLPPKLKGHMRFVERSARRLARDLFHMIARHREGLQKKQLLLARLVDIGAELFAMGAVLSRASSPRAPAGAIKLADLFCRGARRRVDELHRAVYSNDDPFVYRTAREILDGSFPWLEENIVSTWKNSRP